MAATRVNGGHRSLRRWTFADCVFDEANWALAVGGRRVPVESKPLELLRQLLLHAGNLVSKDELLDAIWPDVAVVEASLPTAVGKLRRALKDDRRKKPIIETVPRIGYRLAVPVAVEDLAAAATRPSSAGPRAPAQPARPVKDFVETFADPRGPAAVPKAVAIAAVLAIASGAVAMVVAPSSEGPPQTYTQRDAANALRKLDVVTIERMLAAGWDPSAPFDQEGTNAVTYVLNICEWDRGHDRKKMLLVVRTLFEAGVKLDRPNFWGDTPYSIAKAPRYCGPDHPVTKSIREMCYQGLGAPGDRCLATYELAKRAPRGSVSSPSAPAPRAGSAHRS